MKVMLWCACKASMIAHGDREALRGLAELFEQFHSGGSCAVIREQRQEIDRGVR